MLNFVFLILDSALTKINNICDTYKYFSSNHRMLLVRKIIQKFVTIGLKPSSMLIKLRIQSEILTPRYAFQPDNDIPLFPHPNTWTKTFISRIQSIDPKQKWFILDILQILILISDEKRLPQFLLYDLHVCLVNNANNDEFLKDNIFYTLSNFLDIKTNIPYLKNGRIQAYSLLYDKLDPFQRQIILKDYLQTFKTGPFVDSYIQDLNKEQQKQFKPIELANRDTNFQYIVYRLKNIIALKNRFKNDQYWSQKRLNQFSQLLDEYFLVLEDHTKMSKIVKNYHLSDIFLHGLNIPHRNIGQKYKQRLAKILEIMTNPDHYGMLYPKDQNIESLIMTNFSEKDRLLIKGTLKNICSLYCKKNANVRPSTLFLMDHYNFTHLGFVFASFSDFYKKLRQLKQSEYKQNIKQSIDILMMGVALNRLQFKKVLKDSIQPQALKQAIDLFADTLKYYICENRYIPSLQKQPYLNLNLQYFNSLSDSTADSTADSTVDSHPKISNNLQKLISNQQKFNIKPIIDFKSDIRLTKQITDLSQSILLLEALYTALQMTQFQESFNEYNIYNCIGEIIPKIKIDPNYICMPRIFDSYLRLKYLVFKKFGTAVFDIIDLQIGQKVEKELNEKWNSLETITGKSQLAVSEDLTYKECLLNILPSFMSPLLDCGKQAPVIMDGININFPTNYVYSQSNIIKNILNSKLFQMVSQKSQLNNLLQTFFKKQNVSFKKNYIRYPYYANYLIEGSPRMFIFVCNSTNHFMSMREAIPLRIYSESLQFFEGYNQKTANITRAEFDKNNVFSDRMKSFILNEK